jgi:hypothetical protein
VKHAVQRGIWVPAHHSDIVYCPSSKLLYDWRSVSQYVLVSSTLVGLGTRYYFLSEGCCLRIAVLSLWGALSQERAGLQFAV